MTARGWLLFAAVSVVWGLPYFFIKVALDGNVPPGFLVWARAALGAAVLVPIVLRRGGFGPIRGRGRAIVAYAACEVMVPMTLISVGEQHVASSLTAILIASMPLMVAVLSLRLTPHDRPSPLRVVGLLLGLVGVAALFGLDVGGRHDELLGAALILVATLAYAIAPFVVERRLVDLDPLVSVAASLVVATVVLLPVAIIDRPAAMPSAHALGSIVMLGTVCTALALVLFFQLIAEVGPSRASVITYMNPLVALLLGVLVLDEHVGVATGVGLVLILLGSWLATLSRGGRAPAA